MCAIRNIQLTVQKDGLRVFVRRRKAELQQQKVELSPDCLMTSPAIMLPFSKVGTLGYLHDYDARDALTGNMADNTRVQMCSRCNLAASDVTRLFFVSIASRTRPTLVKIHRGLIDQMR